MSVFLYLLLFACSLASAEVLNGGNQLGTSISHSHGARNVLTNPAALSYSSELNDYGLLAAYSYGNSHDKRDQMAFSLSYGSLGAAYEKLLAGKNDYSRFSFAVGAPMTSTLFLGTRYSVTSSSSPALSGMHSLDAGLQYRPMPFFSMGLMANHLNKSVEWLLGATLRPFSLLDLSFDVSTPSNNFAKFWEYQGTARLEVVKGIFAYAGYHKEYQGQFGLQIDLGRASLFGFGQPHAITPQTNSKFFFGLQTSVFPKRSVLEPKSAFEFEIEPTLGEESSRGGLFAPAKVSLLDLLHALQRMKKDDSIAAVYLQVQGFSLGLASAQELHQAILQLRESGKTVEVFLGNADAGEYLIAAAASKVHMDPAGEIRILGPRSERFYARGTLDKIGVEGQFIARGEYKSAPELFTRKNPSPASREATLHDLQRLEEEYTTLLSHSRKISSNDYQKIVRHGLFSAEEALQFKLIDSITSYAAEKEKIKSRYLVRSSLRRESDRLSLPKRVAVITASGDILKRKVRLLSAAGENHVTPDQMQRHFDIALSDPRTEAIVLRVSSPGGEVLASHEIASLVESSKKKKPIIISMGDVAASGGYMISAPADHIFANSLTATGSIGVFVGKFSLEGLYKKLDLHKEIMSKYPYAAVYSEGRSWNKEERALIQRKLDNYYSGFLTHVAKHRALSKEAADQAARGRVWYGADALSKKLVDKQGGILDAIAFAKEKLRLPVEDTVVWSISDTPGLFSFLEEGWVGGRASASDLAVSFLLPDAAQELRWAASLHDHPFLYWDPVHIKY
jgi:protease IV